MAALIVVAALLLGAVLADDYGQSWDDPTNADYGEDVLRAYSGSDAFWNHRNLPYYGPVHFASSALLVQGLATIGLDWHPVDVRHFANYVSFLLGLLGFYILARRFFRRNVALVATLLWVSQPLVFGHAFINQKDMPFASFFLLALGAGFLAAETFASAGPESKGIITRLGNSARVKRLWRQSDGPARWMLLVTGVLFVMISVDTVGHFFVLPAFRRTVTAAYFDEALPPIQRIFDRVATDVYKTPLNLYVEQADRIYQWGSVLLLAALFVIFLAISRHFWLPRRDSGTADYGRGGAYLLGGGIILGLLTSMRVVGPFAGLLVSGYLIQRTGFKYLGELAVYWIAAGFVTYLTWPSLWGDPIGVIFDSLFLMGAYERHTLLYRGEVVASTQLPWHYLPTLLAIKLTAVAVALTVIGVGRVALRLLRSAGSPSSQDRFIWIGLWFVVPSAAVIFARTPIYDNVRHVMFIIPPLFLLAAAGVEWLMDGLQQQSLPEGLSALLLLPGFIGIISLHPYEYTYYNPLVGGVEGADGRYELDYWCTSYREAMEYVNGIADPGDTVMAWGPERAARSFSRPDLKVLATYQDVETPDFVLACNQGLTANGFYDDIPVQHEVGKGEAIFARVRHNDDK